MNKNKSTNKKGINKLLSKLSLLYYGRKKIRRNLIEDSWMYGYDFK